ncbi:hypothetical protein GJ744_000769 [Endocarpon pusillum]|uniref:A-kinase anchor protein 7-like phosphoesterase domain-containing protein n=1 Tax=Endocarpon pusillum TaxID=364733 RepID=A0A8H7ACY7_9EURO|nr:hypothetical protein GJ744_000769 [Endocarpon pusillum]
MELWRDAGGIMSIALAAEQEQEQKENNAVVSRSTILATNSGMPNHTATISTRRVISLSTKLMPARNQRPPKPPLTHFLCLPLLTPTSTPQLRASIAHLKSVIEGLQPGAEDASAGASAGAGAEKRPSRTRPLIPPAAFRPLGTLHLTLGVMSLKEAEKLQGALKLLEDLDLEAMLGDISDGRSSPEDIFSRESPVALVLGQSTRSSDELKEKSSSHDTTEDTPRTTGIPAAEATERSGTLTTLSKPISPPSISKQSSATPLKPHLPDSSASVLHTPPHDPTSRLHLFCLSVLHHFKSAGYILSEAADRELTLHATLINTVYAKKRRDGEKKRMGKVTFDATAVLRVFNERGGDTSSQGTSRGGSNGGGGAFTFASSIPINRVQICEMGAKKLDAENDPEGLVERYVVVAEKRILAGIE